MSSRTLYVSYTYIKKIDIYYKTYKFSIRNMPRSRLIVTGMQKGVSVSLALKKHTGILLLRCFLDDDVFFGLPVTLKLRWCRVETKSDAARRDAIWRHPLRRYLSAFGPLPSFRVGIPTPPLVTRSWHRGPIYMTRRDPKLNYDSHSGRLPRGKAILASCFIAYFITGTKRARQKTR